LLNPTIAATRVNPNVNYGLWVMMCHCNVTVNPSSLLTTQKVLWLADNLLGQGIKIYLESWSTKEDGGYLQQTSSCLGAA
jgi:hypothetical protein